MSLTYNTAESFKKPKMIDATSSPNGVYLRKNITYADGKYTYSECFVTQKIYETIGYDEITSLDEYKAEVKTAKIQNAFDEAYNYLNSGKALYALSDTQHIEATDSNIGKLGAYALGFISGTYSSTDTVSWTTKEDELISLTQAQLSTVLQGLATLQSEVWNTKYLAYKTQINACTTIDEVNAINIDYSKGVTETTE